MFQDNIVVYKFVQDLHFFVTGGDHENELLLAAVLQGFFDAVTLLLRYFISDSACCYFLQFSHSPFPFNTMQEQCGQKSGP